MESLQQLIDRHEIFSTTFHEIDGRIMQTIHPCSMKHIQFIDLANVPHARKRAQEIIREEIVQPFDLSQLPLLRMLLLRIGSNEHRLLRVNHHIISDSWS